MLTFLLFLVDVLFNKQSAFPWISTVLFSSTCSLWNILYVPSFQEQRNEASPVH